MISALDLFSLKGRVAVVSGASRGIGHAIATGLESAGARVVACGRSPSPETPVSGRASYTPCDVRDRGKFGALCRETADRHGGIDVYVHAAAVSLSATDEADAVARFTATVEVNLVAGYACALTVSEHMKRRGGGSIAVITSIGSSLAFPDNPGYVASKGGLRMMARALALDLGEDNIRVNAIAPGYVRTSMTESSYVDAAKSSQRVVRTILRRWGIASDLVGAAIFLASDASSYITGQEIIVDGGWTAKGL